jgi:tetratricopeptide (TPR) repeat protein
VTTRPGMEDLDRAATLSGFAINATRGHSGFTQAIHHASLGRVLVSQFKVTKSMDTLNLAVKAHQCAVDFSPNDHPSRPNHVAELADTYLRRFEHDKSIEDFDRAIDCYKDALKATPSSHPSMVHYLYGLGLAFQLRYEIVGGMDNLRNAVSEYKRCSEINSKSPTRIFAAAQAANLLEDLNIAEAAMLLKHAITLLPLVTPRTSSLRDQQTWLSHFSGLAPKAAEFSLRAGNDPLDALQLLELGRGIIVDTQLDSRADITLLEEAHPAIAAQFKVLQDEINQPNLHRPGPIDAEPGYLLRAEENFSPARTNRWRKSLSEFDALVLKIRALDGFDRFLLGMSEKDLKELAQKGPIVVFNVGPTRTDALLVTTSGISSLHLPDLGNADIRAKAKSIKMKMDTNNLLNYAEARKELTAVLEWLWDAAVGPVLEKLGFTDALNGSWPRVWWVTSGWLSLLPIHAAGYHSDKSKNALDRVISSYAPTMKSLAHARTTAKKRSNRDNILVVAMPNTPEKIPLPFVTEEVRGLEEVLPTAIPRQILIEPSREDVLSRLPSCSVIHFACHAHGSTLDSSYSRLCLTDWLHSPLTVGDIAALNLQNIKLAYLSACQTADNRGSANYGEGIHLSTAFLLAGVPSVVGSLWPVKDMHSADVAKATYSNMKDDEGINVDKVAYTLHQAVRQLRDETKRRRGRITSDDPVVWVMYIHMGV